MEQDLQFSENVFSNFNNLFFNPEIERRRLRNEIQDPFYLVAAQVIFFEKDKEPLIRLNQEVKAGVKLKENAKMDQGDLFYSRDYVENIFLNDPEHLDCGHVTMILFKEGYRLSFDFIYNKHTCSKYLKASKEFLTTAKFALEKGYSSAFIDNSFSSIELLAKCILLLETNEKMKGKTNHKTIKTEFNKLYKNDINTIEMHHRTVFNKLSQLRSGARYLENSFYISKNDENLIIESLNNLYNKIKHYL